MEEGEEPEREEHLDVNGHNGKQINNIDLHNGQEKCLHDV